MTTYSYDVYNQLIEINTASGVHETYSYNSEGYRDSKTSNDKVIRYLYEGDKVILEVDGENSEKARSVYGSKLISRTINGENLYYLYNGQGDVNKLVNGEGKEVASYYYDAFGEIVESSGEADNPIRYAGYQYDEATGLYYLNARMYDPTVVRFLQEDTYTGDVKDPLSLNLYTYCHNNPLIYDDPTGHIIDTILDMV
nr:RHS repeat-associated core domain-containing protein [Clostridium bornimense]